MKQLIYAFAFILLITFIGCSTSPTPNNSYFSSTNTLVPPIQAHQEIPERITLEQGWSDDTRMKFWFTSQGSQIIPYSWFTWLEQAESTDLFRHPEHIESLRYLPMSSSKANPSGLPIGFALNKDKNSEDAWVGLTCAACHTNQINYEDNEILIEGAPTLANFVLFFEKLINALNQTQIDPVKFERFAQNVLVDNYSPANINKLRSSMKNLTFALAQRQEVNKLPSNYPKDFTSYGRLDAFGNIQNAGAAFALHDVNNSNAPTAPVSYPFLWGTHQSDVVQWNASAPNTPIIGPLARNTGEVIGVFGGLSIDEAHWWEKLIGIDHSYSSTVNLTNLGKLESWVKDLRSPVWPDQYFPPIDMDKAAKGSLVYGENCASCHQVIARKDEGDKYISVKTPLNEVKTDSAMAWNASHHCSKTLALEGEKDHVLFGERFKEVDSSLDISINGAVGLILKDPIKAVKAGMRSDKKKSKVISPNTQEVSDGDVEKYVKQHNDKLDKMEANVNQKICIKDKNDVSGLVYKARPLNGIWATAPYLHNGSVANLNELLKTPQDRAKTFWVGSREFDPLNVGFNIDEGLSKFNVVDNNGSIQHGNSNLGHAYGTTELNDNDKLFLIEFLKTL